MTACSTYNELFNVWSREKTAPTAAAADVADYGAPPVVAILDT